MSSLFDDEDGSLFAKNEKKETSVPPVKKEEPKTVANALPDGNLLCLPVLLSCVDPRTNGYVKIGPSMLLFKRERGQTSAILVLPNKSAVSTVCEVNISWILQNCVYCTLTTPQSSTFLLQFRNPQEACFATSVALFARAQRDKVVSITSTDGSEDSSCTADVFIFEIDKSPITPPSAPETGVSLDSRNYLKGVKAVPNSQYVVSVEETKVAFVVVKSAPKETPQIEITAPVVEESVAKEEEDEYEYEYEEEEEENEVETVSFADILNDADKRFDQMFRSLESFKIPKTYNTEILDNDEMVKKLEKEIRISDEKDRMLNELDSRIKYLSRFSNNEKHSSSDRISYKTEELEAANAIFKSTCSDLEFEEKIFNSLSAKIGQHDKEVEKKIEALREQSKKEFDTSNKQITDEIKELQEKVENQEKEKLEFQNKALEIAREAALIKAGGSKEAEKLKGEIVEKLKTVVQEMVSDVFDMVNSTFDDEESYDGSMVIKAIQRALERAADDVINPDDYSEEEDEYDNDE